MQLSKGDTTGPKQTLTLDGMALCDLCVLPDVMATRRRKGGNVQRFINVGAEACPAQDYGTGSQ